MQTKIIGGNGTALIVPESYELQNESVTGRQWRELGTSGIEAISGFIMEAYNAKLFWPEVESEYERLRRSCPPIVMTRQVYTAQAGDINIDVVLPDDPTPDEKKLGELYESELENVEGGFDNWMQQYLSQVPFKGWGWWEVVPGLRQRDWRPPDADDNWQSEADDGYIGVRRLAWRDQSSFEMWDMTDETGRLKGMWQNDYPNERTLIPLDRSLHVTFGDSVNPEGLTPLEAVWRLEYIQRAYEMVMGIGSEHAAGYLDIRKTAEGELTTQDLNHIKRAAKAILTAQESNYATWPYGFEGKVMDIPFSAAADILEAIRYYGLLMLQLYNMGHIAIATTANTGSYSARESGSSDFLFGFNQMVAGGVKQYDAQVGSRLYKWNESSFPNARRPHYKARPLDKLVGLQELGDFWRIMSQTMPVGEDDYIAIRTKSGILPETLPENMEVQPLPNNTDTDVEQPDEGLPVDDGELASRPFIVPRDELPVDVSLEAVVSEEDVNRAVRKFRRWAQTNEPGLARLLDAEVDDGSEG